MEAARTPFQVGNLVFQTGEHVLDASVSLAEAEKSLRADRRQATVYQTGWLRGHETRPPTAATSGAPTTIGFGLLVSLVYTPAGPFPLYVIPLSHHRKV